MGRNAGRTWRDPHRARRRVPAPTRLLRRSRVWLLAPTWIALNAGLGLYTSQTLFQLVRTPDERFADQWLVGGFDPIHVTIAFLIGGAVFLAGLLYWGGMTYWYDVKDPWTDPGTLDRRDRAEHHQETEKRYHVQADINHRHEEDTANK